MIGLKCLYIIISSFELPYNLRKKIIYELVHKVIEKKLLDQDEKLKPK